MQSLIKSVIALVAAVVAVIAVNIVAGFIVPTPKAPAKPAYPIEVKQAEAAPAAAPAAAPTAPVAATPAGTAETAAVAAAAAPTAPAADATATPAAAAPAAETFASLLAKADVKKGEASAKVCATCHSFGKGEKAKMGPNLYGIVGANHAHMAGFAYSDGMKATASKTWTPEELDAYLTDPKKAVPGNKMAFGGIKNPADRANVILYLQSLSK